MRRYRMRQKLFSLRDTFDVKDENGDVVYVVKGKLISLGDRLSFQDPEGHELLHISQTVISLRPRYEIHREGRHLATVAKKLLSLIGDRFEISVEGGEDLLAKGNFLDYEYHFLQNDEEVAEVSKRWFSLTDAYGVEIEEGVDDLLILASAVIIDMVNHDSDD